MGSTASPAASLLAELARRGIELQAQSGKLRYRPRASLTPELAVRVKTHKSELLVLLAQRPATAPPRFRFTDGHMNFGDICAGWSPAGWADELRRKAGRCDLYRPDIAERYRNWAADIERRLGNRDSQRRPE